MQIAFCTQNHQDQKHLAGSRWEVRRSDLSKPSFACALVWTAVVSSCFIFFHYNMGWSSTQQDLYNVYRILYTVLILIHDKPIIPPFKWMTIGHITTLDHGTHTIYVGGSCSISKHLTATDGRSTGASQQNARQGKAAPRPKWLKLNAKL